MRWPVWLVWRNHRRQAAAAILALLVCGGSASAYFSGGLAAGSGAAAQAASLPQAATPAITVNGNSVHLSWSQTTVAGQALGSYSGGGYLVQRYPVSGGGSSPAGSSCAGPITGSAPTLNCTDANLPPGTWYYEVTPVFNNWVGPASAPSANVTTGAATDTLSVSADPATVGTAVTYTATVTGGGATPTGSVTFEDGGVAISGCGVSGAVSLSAGVATCTATYSTVGSHSITAAYSGDSNYSPTAGTTLSEPVNPGTAADTLTASVNPDPVGGQVTYSATVTGGGVMPTGSITFKDGGVAIGGCGASGVVSLSSGVATCTVTYSAVGSHSITAAYSGDGNYNPAAGSTLGESVVLRTPTDTVTSSSNPSLLGGQVVYTATVSGSGGTPTGSVTFEDGGTAISSCGTNGVVGLSGGIATCSITYAAAGSHSITAAYSGDANYSSAAGNTLTQVVRTSSSSTVTANYNPVAVGAQVVFTATVTGSGGTPTGPVTFEDGGVAISGCGSSGVVSLSSGVATCTVSYSSAGTHSITAVYSGDSSFGSSASSVLHETVSADSNTLTQATPNESGKSAKLTFSGTVTDGDPVTLYYCTGTLSTCTSGSATGSVTITPTGSGSSYTWTTGAVQLTKGTAYTSQGYQTDPLGLVLVSGVQQFTP